MFSKVSLLKALNSRFFEMAGMPWTYPLQLSVHLLYCCVAKAAHVASRGIRQYFSEHWPQSGWLPGRAVPEGDLEITPLKLRDPLQYLLKACDNVVEVLGCGIPEGVFHAG